LANIEYLAEVASGQDSPMTAEEHGALLADTLDAMQRLRTTLEGMSEPILRDPLVLEEVRLWTVAQRVVDALPSGARLVELKGTLAVRGWGDESKLVEVASMLVRRAIERQAGAPPPLVTIHVYAHGTEACLTIRERPLQAQSLRRTSEDPFTPMRTPTNRGHSGLLLAAARHAVVKMGGTLSFVSQKEAGCAFRLRIPLAQPETN
jgi:C4-dicarboxylate-specific signal transduction histidine kinase